MSETEALAAELSGAAPEYVHLAIPNHMQQARSLLASDWLAAHVAARVAEAMAPIEALCDEAEEWSARCMSDHGVPGAAVVSAKRIRAALPTPEPTP